WQAHTIHQVLQGYDGIVVAATGLGKSLIFEGTAKLAGSGKAVVVICPLKSLKRDQAQHAINKGLFADTINEDTEKTPELWRRACNTSQLIYISPETAKSDLFRCKVWNHRSFCSPVAAAFVDETHVIDEWGNDKFRPVYRELNELWTWCGYGIPIWACTATAHTSTFDLVWRTLCFGCWPFWSIDVGADCPNLFFHTCVLKNINNPMLDALNL
ncbi:P-loop containing nucleoside triphosphate hydrolase protein, partial [Lentinula lateritia]